MLEGGERILNTYPPDLSAKAVRSLEHIGVTVQTGAVVTDVQPDLVTFSRGGQTEQLRCGTVLWGAGVEASPLGRELAKQTGAELDRAGRVLVQPDLSLPGHPEIFVLGDLASCAHQTGKPLPGVAPVAMQQGRYVANLIARGQQGAAPAPFHYRDRGAMATIGRNAAVADFGWVRFGGFLAWLAWLFIHVLFLIEFENRLLVMLQWGWNYLTRNRAARLITGSAEPAPFHLPPTPDSTEERGATVRVPEGRGG